MKCIIFGSLYCFHRTLSHYLFLFFYLLLLVHLYILFSELGEGARRRLQMFAINFENRLNGRPAPTPGTPGVLQEDSGAVAERRGLLDDDGEEEIEFEMREKKSN